MRDDHGYKVTAGMERLIGDMLDMSDRHRLADSRLRFESFDGRARVDVSAAVMEVDDEDALRGFLVEECGTDGRGLADRFIADWQAGDYRAAVLALRDAGVDFTLQPRLDIRSWADRDDERALESGGLDGVRARLDQAMTLIGQVGELLGSADMIALDEDPHYLAAAFTGGMVGLCDRLEQAVRHGIEEVDGMQERRASQNAAFDPASPLVSDTAASHAAGAVR